jgi:hypothetical protein
VEAIVLSLFLSLFEYGEVSVQRVLK